ncbi:MAG: ABC transporter permease [Sporichthyaceae bacterium]
MRRADTVRTAGEAIKGHRMRSALTMVGILIGIAAVTVTVGLGQGAQAQVRDQIDALGSNLLIVSPGSTTTSTGVRGGRGSATTLTVRDAETLADPAVAPDVAAVAAVSSSNQTLAAGTTTWTASVVGTSPEWLSVRERTLSAGRFLSAGDVAEARSVAVIGPDTASELFGGRDPIGQTVSIADSTFTIVGVLEPMGSTSATSEDDLIVVPSSTYSTRIAGGANRTAVSTIYVQADSREALSAAHQEISAALATNHGVTAATADFSVTTQQSLVTAANATNRTLTVMLGGIAAISLLVGAIGVMNIMLVSVTERTGEIGLRKAVGATPKAVRTQFLTEAGALGLAGGALGLGLGLGVAAALPRLLDQPVAVSPTVAVGSLAVSLLIGCGAGVYPAARAARLTPIDALRTP